MKKQLIYILFSCLLFTACKKNELPKVEEESSGVPVFYFKCNVNGAPMKIEAGIGDYVMNPSHFQDENNLYVYKGELKQSACPNNSCGFGLSVLINDFKLSDVSAAMDVNKGLAPGSYGFNDGSVAPLLYEGSFRALQTEDVDYLWKINNGANEPNLPTVIKYLDAGLHSVNLQVVSINGNTNLISRDIRVGNPLQANIKMQFVAGEHHFSTDLPAGKYKYAWDFGDPSPNAKSTLENPSHVYQLPLHYVTTLTVTNSNNDTCVTKYYVNNASDPDPNFISTIKASVNPKLLSAITVVFTDQNGLSYSSADLRQSTNSKFEIISVEDYKNNSINEPTKKVKIRFSCNLKSAAGPVNITDGEAVIAVSYK